MKVIVDTCIWSLALRRNTPKTGHLVDELKELISEVRVQLIGPIRQELLSGIKSKKQFRDLRDHLSAFPDLQLESEDFEIAAEYYNLARTKGIQGSNTDFLICSLAHKHKMPIFTTDKNFEQYVSVIPIKLYVPRLNEKS
jgi:predicted nucleic acid-binding protein